MAVIALLSLIPGTPTEGDSVLVWAVARVSPGVQNLGHVVLYGILSLLWMRTLGRWGVGRIRSASLIIAITFGILLELGQLQVPGRFGSLYDALLNALGAVIGVWVLNPLQIRLSSR
jgi:VanZ family protein